MFIKNEFCLISSCRREVDANQYWLRNALEECSSQKRGLTIQACAVETEKYVTKKQAFAKRHT
jgi:hypothetical protein